MQLPLSLTSSSWMLNWPFPNRSQHQDQCPDTTASSSDKYTSWIQPSWPQGLSMVTPKASFHLSGNWLAAEYALSLLGLGTQAPISNLSTQIPIWIPLTKGLGSVISILIHGPEVLGTRDKWDQEHVEPGNQEQGRS
jgi:hypothetical protein